MGGDPSRRLRTGIAARTRQEAAASRSLGVSSLSRPAPRPQKSPRQKCPGRPTSSKTPNRRGRRSLRSKKGRARYGSSCGRTWPTPSSAPVGNLAAVQNPDGRERQGGLATLPGREGTSSFRGTGRGSPRRPQDPERQASGAVRAGKRRPASGWGQGRAGRGHAWIPAHPASRGPAGRPAATHPQQTHFELPQRHGPGAWARARRARRRPKLRRNRPGPVRAFPGAARPSPGRGARRGGDRLFAGPRPGPSAASRAGTVSAAGTVPRPPDRLRRRHLGTPAGSPDLPAHLGSHLRGEGGAGRRRGSRGGAGPAGGAQSPRSRPPPQAAPPSLS